MSKRRLCKRCNASLSDWDPHTICKSCRQPDPQMFFCSDYCTACSVVKDDKALVVELRNHEFENIEKKLNPIAASLSNVENASSHYSRKKVHYPFRFSPQQMMQSTSSNESQMSEQYFDQLKERFSRQRREVVQYPPVQLASSIASSPSSAGEPNLEELEKRIFNKIMSTIGSNISSDKISSPVAESTQIRKAPDVDLIRPAPDITPVRLSSKDEPLKKASEVKPPKKEEVVKALSADELLEGSDSDIESNVISLFKTANPDCLAKCNRGPNENSPNDYVLKISSMASDILLKLTILSSPSHACQLREQLELKEDCGYWPAKVNAGEILRIGSSKLPNMRLHPKVRHLHSFLFGKLNPTLPSEVLHKDFTIPEVSDELKNEFLFAREQLQRLLLMFSMLDHFNSAENVDVDPSCRRLFNVLLKHMKVSLEKQANFLGLLIQEIRRDLLCDADCKDPLTISNLIAGPVHATQFFGPYVKVLEDNIQKHKRQKRGGSLCIYSKSQKPNINLFKLPPKYTEKEDATKFVNKLQVFYESNATTEKDKVAIFESLLPKPILNRLANFIKPNQISHKTFAELSVIFERIHGSGRNWLTERHSFVKISQSKGKSLESFVKELETVVNLCNYRTSTREMLRDQFVFGLYDKKIKEFLLKKFSWSFEECYEYASSHSKIEEEEEEEEEEKEEVVCEPVSKSLRSKNETPMKKVEKKIVVDKTKEEKKTVVNNTKEEKKTVVNNTKGEKRTVVNNTKEEKENKVVKKRLSVDKPIVTVKKLKICDNNFYKMYSSINSSKGMNINNQNEWNSLFGFNVDYSYEVHCPFTGRTLRE